MEDHNMEFPAELKNLIYSKAEKYSISELKAVSKSITEKYKSESGMGKRLVTEELQALVYAVVRMPSTFGAVYSALEHTLECVDIAKDDGLTLLDAGAGTGGASWAAAQLLELSSVTCIERENEMRRLGQELMDNSCDAPGNAVWKAGDIGSTELPERDIVISSYVLNEMSPKQRAEAAVRLWEKTAELLLVIEPGTPAGFSGLMEIRSLLLSKGAFVAAPCVSCGDCPLPENDWCHFTVRVQRSRLHKLIKEADVPYEDEKFSYMAFVRKKPVTPEGRVLRHPAIGKGSIGLELCTGDGLRSRTVTKKDKENFRIARKLSAGDSVKSS